MDRIGRVFEIIVIRVVQILLVPEPPRSAASESTAETA